MSNPGNTNKDAHPEEKSSCGCCHGDGHDSGAGASTPQAAGDGSADAKANPADEELVPAGEPEDAVQSGDDVDATQTAADDIAAQLAERTEDLQRVTAEYANFRRRTERDRQTVIATTKSSVITDFLPVIDDLELAEKHGDLTGPLKAISAKLRGVFDKLDVTQFGAVGEPFDPSLHEAVQDTSQTDTKVIGTVLRPGFKIGERLVRTAMVVIADPEDAPAS